jgi:hypothetical protein
MPRPYSALSATLLSCMKNAILALTLSALAGCTSPQRRSENNYERLERQRYREGVRAAKADLRRGVLAFESIRCEEEEGNRILWCYKRLLSQQYGVEYRVVSPSLIPGVVGRASGYDSVTLPRITAKLGHDWQKRIEREAKVYYRAHWKDVGHLYEADGR